MPRLLIPFAILLAANFCVDHNLFASGAVPPVRQDEKKQDDDTEKDDEQEEDGDDKESKITPTFSDIFNETVEWIEDKHGEVSEPTDSQLDEFVGELEKRLKKAKRLRVKVLVDEIREDELKLKKVERQIDDTSSNFMFLHRTFKRVAGRTVVDRSDQYFKLTGMSKTKIEKEIQKGDNILVDFMLRDFKIYTGVLIKSWGGKTGKTVRASRKDLYTVRVELTKKAWHVGVGGNMTNMRYAGKTAVEDEASEADASETESDDDGKQPNRRGRQ